MKLYRPDISPRTFADPGLMEAVETTQEALDTVPLFGVFVLEGYTATGDPTQAIDIAWEGPSPDICRVERVVLASAPASAPAAAAVTPHLNHTLVPGSVRTWEPFGLTADVVYDLTFFIARRVD